MNNINCILLIDDNKADNTFHTIKIKKAAVCNVISVATTGVEALDYLAKAGNPDNKALYPAPDLIYLDINLPGMDGFEFLEQYHQLEERLKSKAVIIMLTTSLNPDDKTKALSYKEVKQFINKPLTVELIKESVQTYF